MRNYNNVNIHSILEAHSRIDPLSVDCLHFILQYKTVARCLCASFSFFIALLLHVVVVVVVVVALFDVFAMQ